MEIIIATFLESFPEQKITEKFKKREFAVEFSESAQYPQQIKLEVANNMCDVLDEYKHGDEVEIHFNFGGRPWTNKEGVKSYFNTLKAFKVLRKEYGQQATGAVNNQTNTSVGGVSLDDDMPF